ncbi:MAG: succinylglutamate desuccinylase/aspartoacylase family protein [Chloroflexi bacterium]|nr:succinylglutamate desuccinylase/aspartoacylase family protein [Chloroflexota bacterium]
MQSLTVGTASAEPGTRVRGVIPVTNLPGGRPLDIPIIVIHGAQPGPCVWVDAVIHGDEPEGTLACHIVDSRLDPAAMRGSVVLVPVLNVPAYEAAQRGNPLDTFSYDLNRIYPGKADGYLTERLAHKHSVWLREVATYEISIHSGGAHSYLSETIFATTDEKAIELAQAMGRDWKLILKSFLPKGSPPAVMYEAGKQGITVELGGRPATSPADFDRCGRVLADGIMNVLRHYKVIDGAPTYADTWHTGVQHALLAPVSGLFLAEPRLQVQVPMKQGDLIARIVDVYGDLLTELRAPVDGMIFGLRALPNVQTGDWCCFYAEIQGELSRAF